MAVKRRALIGHAAAFSAAGALGAPALVRAEAARVLRFIPQSDVTALDPVWTSVYVTRNHGYLVFDTLYGQDSALRIQPQMVDGAYRRETAASLDSCACGTGCCSTTARRCWRGIAWPASGAGPGGMRSGRR